MTLFFFFSFFSKDKENLYIVVHSLETLSVKISFPVMKQKQEHIQIRAIVSARPFALACLSFAGRLQQTGES